MIKIQAIKPTRLTKREDPDKTVDIAKGRTLVVEEVMDFNGSKLFVKLGYQAGSWLIDTKDWLTEFNSTTVMRLDEGTERLKETKNRATQDGLMAPVYFNQWDNARDPHRTCFSSSAAMLLKFYKPGAINSDDEYLKRVFQRGDSTEASVQLETLKSYELNCEFSTTRSLDWLKDLVQGGDVAACGLLHNGHWKAPKNDSGHYVLVYGYSEELDFFYVHDPGGLPDPIKGGFIRPTKSLPNPGQAISYPANFFIGRWCPEGDGNGWALSLL